MTVCSENSEEVSVKPEVPHGVYPAVGVQLAFELVVIHVVDLNSVVAKTFLLRDSPFECPLLRLDQPASLLFLGPVSFNPLVNRSFIQVGVYLFQLKIVVVFVAQSLELAELDVAEDCEKECLSDVEMGGLA